MITGEKVLEVSGKKGEGEIKGFSIGIHIDGVSVDGGNVEIGYTYTVNYGEGAGELKMRSRLLAKEDVALAKKISEEWESRGALPAEYAETVVRTVNYSGSANGTLVARVLGLPMPQIPPKVTLKQKGKE